MAGLDFSAHFRRMRAQLGRLGAFRLPPGVVMWSRAVGVLYGLVVELAPGIRPLDLFGPYVMEFLQTSVAPEQPGARASERR